MFEDSPAFTTKGRPDVEGFVESVADLAYPINTFAGDGIVTCAGGEVYTTNAYALVRLLRHLGCWLPVCWVSYEGEINDEFKRMMEPFKVSFMDVPRPHDGPLSKAGGGFQLKSIAATDNPFERFLFLDSDSFPVENPSFVFDALDEDDRAVFFRDPWYFDLRSGSCAWPLFWQAIGVDPIPDFKQTESGQFVVDKRTMWRALAVTRWMNEHSDYFYQYMFGDKDTFTAGWLLTNTDVRKPKKNAELGAGAMTHFWFDDRPFTHHFVSAKLRPGETFTLSRGYPHRKFCMDLLYNDIESLRKGGFLCPKT